MKPQGLLRQNAPHWGANKTSAPMWGNTKRNMFTIIHNLKNFFDTGQSLLISPPFVKKYG